MSGDCRCFLWIAMILFLWHNVIVNRYVMIKQGQPSLFYATGLPNMNSIEFIRFFFTKGLVLIQASVLAHLVVLLQKSRYFARFRHSIYVSWENHGTCTCQLPGQMPNDVSRAEFLFSKLRGKDP
jgi:hypothetical protein